MAGEGDEDEDEYEEDDEDYHGGRDGHSQVGRDQVHVGHGVR